MQLTKEEIDIATEDIIKHHKININQLEYVGAVRCQWRNDKAILATFHDTKVKTSRSAKLYW